MALTLCPNCRLPIQESAAECPHCGAERPQAIVAQRGLPLAAAMLAVVATVAIVARRFA